jgi:bacterial/archaeal transporter family-2 protein
MAVVLFVVALVAGALLPIQAGVNNTLRLSLGSPILVGVVSAFFSFTTLFAISLVLRLPMPSVADAASAPAYAWLGGLMGAFSLLAFILLAPRLGAGTLVALVVTGQIASSLVLDQFGLLGYPLQQASPPRILGAILLVAGVVLVRLF